MSRGAFRAFLTAGLAALVCAAPAKAGLTQYGDLGLVYEQTTTNIPSPPDRGNQSSYNPCDLGDAAGLPLLAGGGWVYDSDPMVTPFDTGQAYLVGLKFRSQVPPNTPESWHETVDNVSTNSSLGIGELTVCGDVDNVSYVKEKGSVPKKDSAAVAARCPTGKYVMGGGGVVKGRLGKPRLVGSYPIDTSDGNELPDDGWKAIGYNGAKKPRKILAYAVCAPVDDLDYRLGNFSVPGPRGTGELSCLPGEYAVGGGFRVRGDLAEARAVESRAPSPFGKWRVTVDSFAPTGVESDIHVICHS